MLNRSRRVTATVAAFALSIGLVLTVSPVAASSQAAATPSALSVAGKLVVTISDPGDDGASQTFVDLVTPEGVKVALDGDVPGTARSGDSFVGTVAVPEAVVAEVVDDAVADALDASTAAEPVTDEAIVDAVLDVSAGLDATLTVVQGRTSAPESGPAPEGTAAAPVAHKVWVIVVAPTLSQANGLIPASSIPGLIQKMSDFFVRETDGQISSITIPSNVPPKYAAGPCTSTDCDWDWAASQFGRSESSFQGSNGEHLVILRPGSGGLGNVGNQLHFGGVLDSGIQGYDPFISGYSPVETLAHELGHNVSWGHANMATCGGAVTDSCTTITEYGDFYSIMGNANDNLLRETNPQHLYDIGVLDTTEITTVKLTYPATSGSFTETINVATQPLDRALRILEPSTRAEYFVDYRTGTGADAGAYYISGTSSGVALGLGLRVMKQDPDSPGATVLLPVNSDASLNTSQVFRNATNSIIVTVQSVTSTTATVKIDLAGTTYPEITPVYRFWSENRKSHFFTSSLTERDFVIATYDDRDWLYEGEAWKAFAGAGNPGTIPVFRFWSQTYQGHFYTASASERDAVIANYDDVVWRYEGPAYWVYPYDPDDFTSQVDYVYRFWSEQNKHHFYTASYDEADYVANNYPWYIWSYEGVQFSVPRS